MEAIPRNILRHMKRSPFLRNNKKDSSVNESKTLSEKDAKIIHMEGFRVTTGASTLFSAITLFLFHIGWLS